MAAKYTAELVDGEVVIKSTDDGQEVNTNYLETSSGTGNPGNSAQESTTQEGDGRTIVWSTPVQDGTRGLTGDRGPGTFNRVIQMVRPSTNLTSRLLSQNLADGEVTEIFGDFSSGDFLDSGTVTLGNPEQTFTYTSKGNLELSLVGPSGQFFTEVATDGEVEGFLPSPPIDSSTTANVTISSVDLVLNYNQIASQTICNDQLGDYTISGTAGSCSLDVGKPIAGDVVIVTFINTNELPGNTTTSAAIYNADENATPANVDDDWTEFEFVIDGDLLVQGTIVAEALIIDGATLQAAPGGLGVLTVGKINAANINANQITTKKLAAGAATFDKIDLNGQLVVSTEGSGAISWGKNDAADLNGKGLYLGNANATNPDPRFLLGDASSYIYYDGSQLYIVGAVSATANAQATFYKTFTQTFNYTISPVHTQLNIQMVGAGGGGGGVGGTDATDGGETVVSVRERQFINGLEDYSKVRQGLLGSGSGETLKADYTNGTSTATITTSTTEGFLSNGNLDLVTTAFSGSLDGGHSGGMVVTIDAGTGADAITAPGSIFITGDQANAQTFNFQTKDSISGSRYTLTSTTDTVNVHDNGTAWDTGSSIGTFDYTSKVSAPDTTTNLRADVDGRFDKVTEILVESVSGFPTPSGKLIFNNGEEFDYTSVDNTTDAEKFISTTAQTLGFHEGTGVDETVDPAVSATKDTVSTEAQTHTFTRATAKSVGTHGQTNTTTVTGDLHEFTASGGVSGGNSVAASSTDDGDFGERFDVNELFTLTALETTKFFGVGGDGGADNNTNGQDGGILAPANGLSEDSIGDGGGGVGSSSATTIDSTLVLSGGAGTFTNRGNVTEIELADITGFGAAPSTVTIVNQESGSERKSDTFRYTSIDGNILRGESQFLQRHFHGDFIGQNTAGEGGRAGAFLNVLNTATVDQGKFDTGRYDIASTTDRVVITIGQGGTGSVNGAVTGGDGGPGAVQITGN